jgi:hypothetical protein
MARRRPIPNRIPHPYPSERFAPLSTAWFIASMVGLIVSVGYLWKISLPWATAFSIVFIMMLVASFVSMRRATPDSQLVAVPKKLR